MARSWYEETMLSNVLNFLLAVLVVGYWRKGGRRGTRRRNSLHCFLGKRQVDGILV